MPRSASADVVSDASDEAVAALHLRVRRLEDAVAALQDTNLMEDRLVERVVQRIDHAPDPFAPSGGLLMGAARMLLPKTIDAASAGEPLVPAADGPANGAPTVEGTPAGRPSWVLVEVVRDFRAIGRMLMDYRYRMSWTGRVVVPAAIAVAVLSWWLLSGSFLGVGTVIDKTIDVVLVVVVYKVLGREVQRYRELLSRVAYRYR
jgi:hypothetical protein